MGFVEVFLLGIGLSMDAFAIAVCKGLNMKKSNLKNIAIIALFFGFFQFLMPIIGFYFCISFEKYIESFDHWIVFVILLVLGLKMIIESLKKEKQKGDVLKLDQNKLDYKELFFLGLATSIDALAAGIALAVSCNINIFVSSAIIGATTFVLSFIGVFVGNLFGEKFKKPAEIIGGATLILIGIKVLLEHLGIVLF